MSTTDNGGPAFPTKSYNIERDVMTREEGMYLRDYFAAEAMQGMMHDVTQPRADVIASWAYEMADAMLKAREA